MSLRRNIGRALRHRRAGTAQGILARLGIYSSPTIKVTSPAFDDGYTIPDRYCAYAGGRNISPPLTWSNLPSGTKQLLLVVQDPDVPLPRPITHCVALLYPEPEFIADGLLAQYHGPRPLVGHGLHHYQFYLFALDCKIDLRLNRFRLGSLIAKIRAHVLGWGILIGVSERP